MFIDLKNALLGDCQYHLKRYGYVINSVLIMKFIDTNKMFRKNNEKYENYMLRVVLEMIKELSLVAKGDYQNTLSKSK